MVKYALKEHKPFKSETERAEIIGGDTDYCARRFGYRRDTKGISATLTHSRIKPSITAYDVTYAEYLPLYGNVVITSKGNSLYYWNNATRESVKFLTTISNIYPSVHAYTEGDVHCYVVVSGNYLTKFLSDNKTSKKIISTKFLSTVIHCGRLFGCDSVDRYMLKWSGYDIFDWTEGVDGAGTAHLDTRLGKIMGLFVVGEKIAILREFGITVLNTLGDSRHMRMDLSDRFFLPRVYENSSVICGGQLWIMTHEGMYVFNGSTLSKAPYEEYLKDYVLEKPVVVGNRYVYYSAQKGSDKCLFEYDTKIGAGAPFAKGCFCPFFTDDVTYCLNVCYIGELLHDMEDPDREWVSEPFSFGDGRTRVLKGLTVEGSGNINVEIDCDGRKLYVNAAGKTAFSECGESFTFKITGNCSVSSLTAEWEVRG